jgi:hypothetical protein
MTKNNENAGKVNNSSQASTPTERNTVLNPEGETENQQVTVSKQTLAYLKCLQQLSELWECVYEALELSYGYKTAEEIMNGYHDKSCEIRDMINDYMCVSISEQMSYKGRITKI